MDPTQNALFALAEHRLAWTDQRQTVLAQNIANASVPGYRPRDMPPFAQALQAVTGLAPVQTHLGHLSGTIDAAQRSSLLDRPTAVSPNGNGVSLDEQLAKVAETESTQQTVAAIYRKYFALFQIALGNGSGSQ